MTPAKVLPYLAVLLLGGLIGYFIGHRSAKAVPVPIATNVTEPSNNDTTANMMSKTDTTTGVAAATEPATTAPTSNATATSDALPSDKLCFADPAALSLQLTLFAEGIEKDSIMYDNKNPSKLADCSGMFLRLAAFVKSKCDRYDYPDPKVARGTHELVTWFNSKHNLVVVKNNSDDALAKRNLIKPGAVMFFGKSGQVYNNVDLKSAETNVAHVGTVTEVKTDAQGNVTGYTMFHGRRPGAFAQRSFYHSIEPPRLGYPVLGNWDQQWLAIAYVMTPKSS